MEIDFKILMLNKSDEDLQEYIDNRKKYMPQTIEAVIFEMQRRGRIFSPDEIKNLQLEIDLKRKANELELMNAFRIPRSFVQFGKMLFIFPFVMVLLGLILRQMGNIWNLFWIFFGFTTFFVWSIANTIRVLFNNKYQFFDLLTPAITSMMSVILFFKYLNYDLVDWVGLIVIPIFVITAVIELINRQSKGSRQLSALVFYLLLTIPMFGMNLYVEPRQYLSSENYDRYGITTKVVTKLPYQLRYKETEELYNEGMDLNESENYFDAISKFRKALIYEPNHPRILIELANSYAEINELEKAVSILDSAIMIDKYCSACYCNRGLLFYKLNSFSKAKQDLTTAIDLDTSLNAAFLNLALVYEAEGSNDSVCSTLIKIDKSEISQEIITEIDRIRKQYCK